jgi:hypothetical protein
MLRSIPCDYGGSIAGNLHIECSVERDAARSRRRRSAIWPRVCNNCNCALPVMMMMMMTMMERKEKQATSY